MSSLQSELQRIWRSARRACVLVPAEKVFTGQLPDKYIDREGRERPADPPALVIWTPDTNPAGGSSAAIYQSVVLQVSAHHASYAQAKAIRDFARNFFENVSAQITLPAGEFVSDFSVDDAGELPPVDGVWECFQRFNVDTAFTRPLRKG